ncbi:MAG TPA: DNA alkylation repair protein, partial [Phycisphaerales bacterium]|nr:DNA alkylation repair protein [Phycisphaerales bacterium]
RRDSAMRPHRWHGEREFFYMACEFADRGAAAGHHTSAALPLFKRLIVQSGWWDIVDWVGGKMIGGPRGAFNAEPDKVARVMERWIDDGDLWVRRAAVISQLHRKERTDQRMLARFCLARAHEKDFFMRKAIGWALRQHARTDPGWVRSFLAKHDAKLPRLSVREASKHL